MATAKPRIESDAYYTPAGPVRQILRILQGEYGVSDMDTVLEPACGGGNIIHEVVTQLGADEDAVFGVDCSDRGFAGIRSLHPRVTLWHDDFLTWPWAETNEPYGLCIGNPPYSDDLPEKFIRKILEHRIAYVTAFLLRLNWLGSARRAELHRQYPADVFVLSKRPSFSDDGKTDGCEYAWFVWQMPSSATRPCGELRVLPPYVEQLGLFE